MNEHFGIPMTFGDWSIVVTSYDCDMFREVLNIYARKYLPSSFTYELDEPVPFFGRMTKVHELERVVEFSLENTMPGIPLNWGAYFQVEAPKYLT